MKDNPKISIITVVYNDVHNIEKTIKNTLSQTYNNMEYIVVDGGSSDGTLDIIKKYDNQIVWKSEPDRGIYDAMTKGANMASGEWILFRNSGDLFFDDTVIDRIFSIYEDKGESFVAGNIRYVKSSFYKDMKPHILVKHFFDSMPFHHPATFIRRETQLKYPFNLQYRNSADYDFFIKALLDGATYVCRDEMVAIFDANYGASTDKYDLSLTENIKILNSYNASECYVSAKKEMLNKELRNKKMISFKLLKTIHYCWSLWRGGWKRIKK